MKTLQLVPAMEQGGVERGVVEMNRAIVAAGWQNVVVSAGGRLASVIEKDGGRHLAIDVKSKNPLTYFSRAARLRKALVAERPDVVCAHSRVPAWLFRRAARGLGIPWITFAHGANSVSPYSRIMTAGDLTVTPSRFVAEYLKDAYGIPEEKLLEMAAHAEGHSSHPISQSIQRAYQGRVDLDRVSHVEEHSGRGITALVDGKKVAVGNLRLMEHQGIEGIECHSAGTIIHTAVDGAYAGHMVISDSVKDGAKEAVAELKKSGVHTTVMLTGDLKSAAEAVASEVGIDRVYAELMPADKVRIVEEMLSGAAPGEKVAFAGDGINDAPVLSRADIGIAMGALGSDAAIEAADVVLMDDDPRKIGKAIRIARKCIRIVYENIYFAIGVKAACLILGALGIANMWLAIFADVGVMVLCVLNAIRCLRVKNV